MSVYLTKSMLSKLNKVKYSICDYNDDEDCGSNDPWQKLSIDGYEVYYNITYYLHD